jgi:hypothetical protein
MMCCEKRLDTSATFIQKMAERIKIISPGGRVLEEKMDLFQSTIEAKVINGKRVEEKSIR